MIAEIVPFARLPKSLLYFDYEVPQNLEGQIKIGKLVKIHFKGRQVNGLIIKTKFKSEIKGGLKQITKVLDLEPQVDSVRLKLLWWLSNYYFTSPAMLVKTFIPEPPARAVGFKTKSALRSVPLYIPKSDISAVQKDLEIFFKSQKNCFLLHYQNLKHKIAVYLKSAEKILKQNKQVLILEPQISDINLILPYFLYLFPGQIAVLHGKQSKTEYWQEWQKACENKAKIVIGTRSAVFAPLYNLGLIIIDDEEMPDFKQSDQNPRYDSRQAALKLNDLTGAKIILASQVPRVETYYNIKTKKYELMANSLEAHHETTLIDMNNELKKGNFSSLSDELQKKICQTLEKKQKIVLLLNRRGASTLVVCRDCGRTFKCADCELPLTCHENENGVCSRLICHRCGHKEAVPLVCPNCRSNSIKFFGTGTQKVEREVKDFFPNIKVSRIDKDVSISKFQIPNSQIFIGTQFFINNYLPQIQNIGLIGVISADTLLFRPDFRSGEKNFEWLTKLINLSRQIKSLLFIQTFFPNNPSIQSAVDQNYDSFYNQEIEERKKFGYPPFGKSIKLVYRHRNEKKCAFEAASLFKNLTALFKEEVEIFKDEKPKKFKQKFISVIVIKFPFPMVQKVMNHLKTVSEGWTIDIDPESLL